MHDYSFAWLRGCYRNATAGEFRIARRSGCEWLRCNFRGAISFSAPRGLLTEVLSAMGETEQSVENFLDVAGEIANILSGRARRHFGEALDIAPPISCEREGAVITKLAEGPAYAIPHTWGSHEAHLVVHLDLIQRR